MECLNCFSSTARESTSNALNTPTDLGTSLSFNRYDQLGEGAHASVYRGTFAGRCVAVKYYGRHETKAWNLEAAVIRKLGVQTHRNIVGMIGSGRVGFIRRMWVNVYELCPKSLKDSLNSREPVSIHGRAVQIAGIAAGVCFLHRNNILHLDIKPANVLLDGQGTAKLCDFSLSRILPCSEDKLFIRGYCFYLAPELSMGRNERLPVNYQCKVADSFGLGFTAYCICKENCRSCYMWDERKIWIRGQSRQVRRLVSIFDYGKFNVSDKYHHHLGNGIVSLNDDRRNHSAMVHEDEALCQDIMRDLVEPALEVDHRKRLTPGEFRKRAKRLSMRSNETRL